MDDDVFIIPSDDILIGGDTGAFINGDESILSESESIVGPSGPPGPKGDPGAAATVTVGSTTTGAAGTSASVTNSGTSSAAVLDFTIPRGVAGTNGTDGFSPVATVTQNAGSATISITDANGTTTATVSDGGDGLDGFSPIATVEQTEFGATITITDSNGTTTADVVNGSQGTPGAAATVTVGSTTTANPGTNASVVNSGTSSAAVLDFTIPRGADGSDGQDGQAATIAVGSTTTGAAGTSASVTNSGTSSAAVFDFVIPRGADGADGQNGAPGAAATIAAGTTTTGAAGSSASVTNTGTSSAAVFDFVIPRGDTGATGPAGPGIVDYSQSEVATNVKWVDNKTIYQKTIYMDSLPNATTKDFAHGASIAYVVGYEGIVTDGTTYMSINTPSVGSNNNNAFRTFINATNVRIATGSDRTSWSGYVTIYYTKS